MIELNEQQQQAVDACNEPSLIDPRTRKAYILVEAGVLGRLRGQAADDAGIDMRQVAALVERAMREDDVNDPTLDFYQKKYGRTT